MPRFFGTLTYQKFRSVDRVTCAHVTERGHVTVGDSDGRVNVWSNIGSPVVTSVIYGAHEVRAHHEFDQPKYAKSTNLISGCP
jgi:hypothetical protein